MFTSSKKPYFGKQAGERVDVEEPNGKTLIGEAVQGAKMVSLDFSRSQTRPRRQ